MIHKTATRRELWKDQFWDRVCFFASDCHPTLVTVHYVRDDVDYDEETSDKKCAVLAAIATNINSYMDETSSSVVLRRVLDGGYATDDLSLLLFLKYTHNRQQ